MPTPTLIPELRPTGRPGHDGGLRLGRPVVRTFTRGADAEPPPVEWRRFMADFCAAYDMEFDLARYARGGGTSFGRMSQALLDGLDRPLPELDAVLLAHHVPDVKVFEIAGCQLTELCPGNPVAFSVSGQGVGAPFTALRILNCMRLAGDLTNGAVFVLDQSSVPYWDADIHDGAAGDSAAGDSAAEDSAVLLRTDTTGVVLDFVDDMPVADPTSALEALPRRFPDARIVVGRELAERLEPGFGARHGIVEGASHRLCTSAWAALAECWPRDWYTVVADYDPHTGRMFQAGLCPGTSR